MIMFITIMNKKDSSNKNIAMSFILIGFAMILFCPFVNSSKFLGNTVGLLLGSAGVLFSVIGLTEIMR